jgi:hypothetical protein
LALIAILLGSPFNASGQHTVEIGGGYSRSRLDREGSNGWNAALTVKPNEWLGITADFGGHYRDPLSNLSIGDFPIGELAGEERVNTFLFGPRFYLSKTRAVTPFCHALVGGARSSTELTLLIVTASRQRHALAFAAGGGVDVKINSWAALRAVQVDYVLTRFEHTNQNRLRLSSGIVFRF